MYRVFNMGVGMIVVVPADVAPTVLEIADRNKIDAAMIGEIEEGKGNVKIIGVD
jgi:phosphoribosylaminoimidazole (AIR) synthetase